MISRREFVVSGGAGLGAWLVGARVVGQILRLARERREPYLITVQDPVHILYANRLRSGYVFTLDCPYAEIRPPKLTWRDWLERKGVTVSNRKEIRDFLEVQGWYQPEEGKRYVQPDLDDALPWDLQENYIDWEYAMYDSPEAQAFTYLIKLPLGDRDTRGEALGELTFLEGLRPGENASLVLTEQIETLGGLQARLLELGQRVQVEVAQG